MNRVEIIGRLTKDIELTTTNSGVSVAKFSIAVNRKFKNEDGEYVADFFNGVAWRGLAENMAKYCKKGSKVFIAGELQSRNYDDNEGKKRYVTEIITNECEFLDSKNTREGKAELQPIEDELPF